MKVYQINVVCGTGSTGRIAVDIYDKIISEGGKCRIAYGRGTAPAGVDSYRVGSDIGLYFHGAISRVFDNQGFLSTRATKDLINDIKSYEPDIIHCHNLHGYYLNLALLLPFFAEYKKPVVLTMHDCFAYTGRCGYYSSSGCEKWKSGCGNCPQKKSYPATFGFDFSSKHWAKKRALFNAISDITYVAPSDWLIESAKTSFLAENSGAKFLTIRNGIDLQAFKAPDDKCDEHVRKIVLGVSTEWGTRKGQDDFKRFIDEFDDKYEIVMIGLTKSQIKDISGAVDRTEYTGKSKALVKLITRTESLQDLCEWYSKADVFVNATRVDNFPTVHLEALACGTGVITYDVGGSKEALLDETGQVNSAIGAVAPPGDYDALVQLIKGSVFDSQACRKQAEGFDKFEKYAEYIDLYKSIEQRSDNEV